MPGKGGSAPSVKWLNDEKEPPSVTMSSETLDTIIHTLSKPTCGPTPSTTIVPRDAYAPPPRESHSKSNSNHHSSYNYHLGRGGVHRGRGTPRGGPGFGSPNNQRAKRSEKTEDPRKTHWG